MQVLLFVSLLTRMEFNGSRVSGSSCCCCICQNVSLSSSRRRFDRASRLCPDQTLMSASPCRAVLSWAPTCSGTGERWWKCWENTSRSALNRNVSTSFNILLHLSVCGQVRYVDQGLVENIPAIHICPVLLCEDVPQLCVPCKLHRNNPVRSTPPQLQDAPLL